MEIKRNLFEGRDKELSVEKFFPRYTRKLADSQLNSLSDQIARMEAEIQYVEQEKDEVMQEQSKRDEDFSEDEIERLKKLEDAKREKTDKLNKLKEEKKEKEQLKRQLGAKDQHRDDELFTKFFEAVIKQETDYWKELCRLVECKYSIYVKTLNEEHEKQKKRKEANEAWMRKEKDQHKRTGYRRDYEDAKDRMAVLEREITKSVIDQEQFFRESHLKVQRDKKQSKEKLGFDPEEQQSKFYESLAQMFEQGQSLEVIDGDLQNLEQESLSRVMEFV